MFQSCRQLSRLTSHHSAVVKVISVKNDSIKSRAYSGKNDEAGEEGHPNHSRSFCPFVLLAKNLTDYVGLIGAGFIVGLKLQRDLCRLSRTDRFSNGPAPNSLLQKALSIRDRYFPLLVINASPVANHVDSSPTCLNPAWPQHLNQAPSSYEKSGHPSPVHDDRRFISGRTLKEYKRDLIALSKNYTADLMNKIGVAFIEAGNGKEGIDCLKTDATCAKALYNLAVAYEKGRYSDGQTAQPDLKLAFEYYERAARMNHKFATFNLALFYWYGKGPIERDAGKGTMLMQKAFQLGVERAAAFNSMRLLQDQSLAQTSATARHESVSSHDLRVLNRLLSSARDVRGHENLSDISESKTPRLAICF